MVVFDRAYIETRNRYLLPLTTYSVPYKKLRNTSIKSIILTKTQNVKVLDNNEYIFYIKEADLLKGLLGDIELFYIRQIIQKHDAKQMSSIEVSANWNIVAYYYHAFFSASLLLRLCHRGNIFFDSITKNSIEKIVASITGEVVKIDSNCFYEIKNVNNEYYLSIQSANSVGTHELVWKRMDQLINEFRALARKKSDEAILLSSIIDINNALTNTYPSKLRNRVNYQPAYCLEFIDNKLFKINGGLSWIKCLLNFETTDDDNKLSCYMYAYTKYIEYFCLNLIDEYFLINGRENGILRQINKKRNEKIERSDVKIDFS